MFFSPTSLRRARRATCSLIGSVVALTAGFVLDTSSVSAASFVVTNLDVSGEGSLADRIADANTATGPDVITFAPGLNGTIDMAATPVITDDLTIVGPGVAQLVLTHPDDAVVRVAGAADFELSGVTVAGSTGHGIRVDGGGDVTISQVTVSGSGDESGEHGVNIVGAGAVTLTDVTALESASDGIFIQNVGEVRLERLASNDNGSDGVVVDGAAAVTVADVSASSNRDDHLDVDDVDGGLTVTDLDFTETGAGNGVDINEVTGDVTVSGVTTTAQDDEGIEITIVGGDVSISDVTVEDTDDEAIRLGTISGSVDIRRVSATRSQAEGIELDGIVGAVTVAEVDVRESADNGIDIATAGGVVIVESFVAGSGEEGDTLDRDGVGIVLSDFGEGLINRSTVIGSETHAVFAETASSLRIVNSTATQNASTSGRPTFGVFGIESVEIDHSTVTQNGSDTAPLAEFVDTSTIVSDSIVTDNATADNPFLLQDSSIATFHSVLPVDNPDAGINGNIAADDPRLSPLGDFGGSTPTMRPLAGSPAIDAGDPAFAAPPEVDQRGVARVAGGRLDAGAVEFDAGVVSIAPATVTIAEGSTAAVEVTRVGVADGPATVDVTTTAGTAGPTDFVAVDTTLSWIDGETGPKTVDISAITDDVVEADETFTVSLSNPTGVNVGTATTTTVTIADGNEAAAIVPVVPARFLDTRDQPTFDGQFSGVGSPGAGNIVRIDVAGRGSIPGDAVGVVANLTAIRPAAPGHATMFGCTDDVPTASHANYVPGDVVANNAVIPLSDDGELCIFALADAHFALDVNGYVPAGSPLGLLDPVRYLDTRPQPTFDDKSSGQGRLGAGAIVEVPIAGRGNIPTDATAAIVNVTLIGADGPGHVTLFPCGTLPEASTLNYVAGDVIPNGALVELSDDGSLCVFTLEAAHLALDVAGFVPAGTTTVDTARPARFLETRPNRPTVDGVSSGGGPIGAGQLVEVQVAGRGDVPADATAAILNVTIVRPDRDAGHVTVYPCAEVPTTSNLNHTRAGIVRANNTITKLSDDGTICLYTVARADFVVDVNGWLTGG